MIPEIIEPIFVEKNIKIILKKYEFINYICNQQEIIFNKTIFLNNAHQINILV